MTSAPEFMQEYLRPQQQGVSKGKPFLLRQLLYFMLGNSLLSLGFSVLAFQSSSFEQAWLWLLTPLIFALPTIYLLWVCLKIHYAMTYMYQTLRLANKGELHHRITKVRGLGGVGKVVWELNEFMDFTETFFKETITSFDYVARDNFERVSLSKGMPGMFYRSLDSVNKSIVEMSKNASLVANNELHSKLHAVNVTNLIHSMERSEEDLRLVGKRILEVQEIAQNNNSAATANQHSVQSMVEALAQITTAINAVSTVIHQLGQDSEKVKSALAMIGDIAEQTNLLALNAAIEAARAGEQGRGFAVVADEVKSLSLRTKNAAQDVSTTIGGFSSRVKKVIEDVSQSTLLAQDISQKAQGFREQFDQFATGAQQTISTVNITTDQVQNLQAKFDHIIYIQNGYISLDQHTQSAESLRAVQVGHEQCRFGNWYYSGFGHSAFGHTSSFKLLEGPHSKLHRAVQRSVQISQQDWLNNPKLKDDIVAAMADAEHQGRMMAEHLDAVLKEKHRL